jgi:hypothetical protein
MAKGDRVRIGDGSTWDESVVVSVYEPRWQPDGSLYLDHFGAAQVVRLGGVKGGTFGTIAGPSIKVHRTQLFGEQNVPTMGGMDLVHVFPIQLDHYQRLGWLPTHHIRVVGGEICPQ